MGDLGEDDNWDDSTSCWEVCNSATKGDDTRFIWEQYTGLSDRNGVKIFEGDIFHAGSLDITYEVVWHDTGFMGKCIGTYGSYLGLLHSLKSIEVIGNIHD